MKDVFFSKLFQSERTANGWLISTPLLDPRNDHITVYVEELPSGLVSVSDLGDTIWDVEISIPGFGSERTKWAWLFREACSHIAAIHVEDGAVTAEVKPEDVAFTVIWVAQACLHIYQLVAVARHREETLAEGC